MTIGRESEQKADTIYRVIVKNSWSYVVGDPMPEHSGPWRYQWEAQEYADELNSKAQEPRHD